MGAKFSQRMIDYLLSTELQETVIRNRRLCGQDTMHKTSLATLAALTLVAVVSAASARLNAGAKLPSSLSMEDVRTVLNNPERLRSKVLHKSIEAYQHVSSARKVNVPAPHATTGIARTTAAIRSIKRTPLVSKKGGAQNDVATTKVAFLRNALKPSSIFKSQAEVKETRVFNNHALDTEKLLPESRRDGLGIKNGDDCLDIMDLADPPTPDQMTEVCENSCCYYREDVAMMAGVQKSDVETLFCAKDGSAFCFSTVPAFLSMEAEPTIEQMATLCDSPCRDTWIGLVVVEALSEGNRRASHGGGGSDWAILGDMMCMKSGTDYCMSNVDFLSTLDNPDDDTPSAANLEELCGPCKDFYFGIAKLSGVDGVDGAEMLLCTKQDDNFCFITPPTFVNQDQPTNAEIGTVCDSPCKVPWIVQITNDDGIANNRRASHTMPTPDYAAMANMFCLKDGTTYCIGTALDAFNTFGDGTPSPQNLTMMCDSGPCKGLYTGLMATELKISADTVDELMCSKDGSNYCLLTAEAAAVSAGAQMQDGMPTPGFFDALCGKTCSPSWLYTLFIFAAQDSGGGGSGSPPPMPMFTADQLDSLMCSKSESDVYCVIEGANAIAAQNSTADGLNKDLLDDMCATTACTSKLFEIAAVMGEVPDEDIDSASLMAFLCAKNGNKYCLLEVVEALSAATGDGMGNGMGNGMGAGMGMGNMGMGGGPPVPREFLELMCGECVAKMGSAGAGSLLQFVGAMSAQDELGAMSAQDELAATIDMIVGLMCLKNDKDYCMLDTEAGALFFGPEEDDDDNEGSAGEIFMNDLTGLGSPLGPSSPGKRKQAAKTFCENSCVNSYASIGLELELQTAREECLEGSELLSFKALLNGCVKHGQAEYCIETIFNAASLPTAAIQCNIDPTNLLKGDTTCSADCKTAAEALFADWGCCAAAMQFPIVGEIEADCAITAPTECERSGKITMGIDVANLKNAWLAGKLSDPVIKAAIRKDIGAAMNVPSGLVKLIRSKAKGNGATIECEVGAPSEELGRALAMKVKGGNRRADVAVSFPSLAAAIPEEDRAAALVDPTVALTGTVDASTVVTDGDELKDIVAEVEDGTTTTVKAAATMKLVGMTETDWTTAAEDAFIEAVAELFGKSKAMVAVTGTTAVTRRRMLLAAGLKVDYEVDGFATAAAATAAQTTAEGKTAELVATLQANDAFKDKLTGIEVPEVPEDDTGTSAAPGSAVVSWTLVFACFSAAVAKYF